MWCCVFRPALEIRKTLVNDLMSISSIQGAVVLFVMSNLILVINVQSRPFWGLKNEIKNNKISLKKG